MRTNESREGPIWNDAQLPAPSLLSGDTHADVCVVGAGIAGLTTAYLLARDGKSVVVIDDGPVAGGQTHRTTAHLSNALDDRYFEIERLHGREGAHLAAESHSAAIDKIEAIVLAEQIDCGFERLDGYLFVPPGEPAELLDRELEAVLRTCAVRIDWAPRAPLEFDTGACLRFRGQGQFHPLKYLAGLARAIQRDGGRICTQTHAKHIQGGDGAKVTTAGGAVIYAGSVVVATNSPVNDLVAIHTKQKAYLTYVIAARVPIGAVPHALYWDTGDPYHYVRLQPLAVPQPDDVAQSERAARAESEELLIVGGEDHKTGQADDGPQRFDRLEAWARERFPAMGGIQHRWSGQVMETIDGLAFIGRNPLDHDNVYIVTGDCGMGMTHGTIAGILLTDLILGRENPWARLYDPARKTVRAAGNFARGLLNVAAQYVSLATPGEVDSCDDVRPGQGAVLRRGLTKHAVFRDSDGHLTELSAICPHLKCVVGWNQVESTWDCPCHGSRFTAQGKVICGPANSDLEEIEEVVPTSTPNQSAWHR